MLIFYRTIGADGSHGYTFLLLPGLSVRTDRTGSFSSSGNPMPKTRHGGRKCFLHRLLAKFSNSSKYQSDFGVEYNVLTSRNIEEVIFCHPRSATQEDPRSTPSKDSSYRLIPIDCPECTFVAGQLPPSDSRTVRYLKLYCKEE